MDIKFRSDLLGRSVLFIGYSFRDINIRIIWFKLKRMMTDIPDEDSPTSFIVTFNPNPVLEALYAAVGIETICLDPKKQAANSVAKSALLSDFMLRLANATATSGHIPGNPGHSLFFSSAISDAVAEVLTEEEKVDPHLRGRFSRTRLNSLYTEISKRVIPDCYQQSVRSLLSSESIPVSSSVVSAALRYFHQFGPESFVTSICLKGLERSEPRRALLGAVVDWKRILAVKLPRSYLDGFLMRFEQEFRYHEPKAQVGPGPDYDIGFFTDIAKRILRGEIIDEIPEDDRQKLSELLERATRLYPALASYRPPTDAPPSSDSISRAILSAKSEAGVTTDDVLF